MSPLLILGIVLIILFGGLGFAAKVLWWGLVIGVVLFIAGAFSGRRAP
jgi:hypothetical protein